MTSNVLRNVIMGAVMATLLPLISLLTLATLLIADRRRGIRSGFAARPRT